MIRLKWYFLYLTSWLCWSCTIVEEIDVGLEEPTLVLNSLFNPDSVWSVDVSETINIIDNPQGISYFPFVKDAVVTIYDENNVLVETLAYSESGISRPRYLGKSKPMPGKKYRIVVLVKDRFPIQATNVAPEAIPISSVEIDSTAYFLNSGDDLNISVTFNDPDNESNYYSLKILRNAYTLVNSDTVRYVEDVYYEPTDLSFLENFDGISGVLFSDRLFNGSITTVKVKSKLKNPLGETERISLVLLSISKQYYQYFITKNLQKREVGDLFSQPVPLFTNVENGVGLFGGYNYAVSIVK